MNVQDKVLCCGCLCAGRKMLLLDELSKKQCFLQIISEIQIDFPENMPIRLCWECAAYTQRFKKFKQKVKNSFMTLNEYAKENLNLQHAIQPSSLQVSKLININIPMHSYEKHEVFTEQFKSEIEWEEKIVSESNSNIKKEDDYISLHSEKHISDPEDNILLDDNIGKDIKKKKLKSNNGKSPKSKQKNKKRKKRNIEKFEFCKEIEFSQTELEEERSQLCSKEEFINALFKCERCIIPFPNPHDLADHVAMKHDLNASNYKCPTCECSFANEVSFNYHRNKHIKRYECLLCAIQFNSKRKVTKHYEVDHCGIVCNICSTAYGTQEEYAMHTRTHEQPQAGTGARADVFPCDSCDKSFRWKSSLRKHMETHRIQTGQKRKPYCETCRLSFTTSSNLQKHVKTSSKHQIQLKLRKLNVTSLLTPATGADTTQQEACIEQIKKSVNNARSTHKCPQCDKRFQWKGNLLRHMQSHTARANGELVCEPCNRAFSSIATYEQHLKISRKHVSEKDYKYTCDECGKKFVNKTRLRDHVDWEHLKRHTHTCNVCQKVFKTHTSLYLHKQVVHKKDDAEHLCDHCGKAFPNHAKLRCHINALHTERSPYSCAICSARFNWHSCLSRHVRVLHRLNKTKRRKQENHLEA